MNKIKLPKEISVVLNWDERETNGEKFDLDLMLFSLNTDKFVISNEHFIFFNNPHSKCKSIILENQSESGSSLEDEKIKINFTSLKEKISYLDILVSIHDDSSKNFGQVNNATISIIGRKKLVLYEENLYEEFSSASFYGLRLQKIGSEWWLVKCGPFENKSLEQIVKLYGVSVKKEV